jgi:outer membrane protein TolC
MPTADNKAVDYFDVGLSASYEIDFWGGKRASRDSAQFSLQASEFDRATVELTLLSGVANSYTQVLSLQEQSRIAELNLANAQNVLQLVQTRYNAGSATALELAQQKSLVAAQQRQLPTGAATGPRCADRAGQRCSGVRCKTCQPVTSPSINCNGRRLLPACPANC